MAPPKRIGILTGGGDCPGLNAAIRAAARTAIKMGYEVIGIRNAWEGLMDDEHITLTTRNTAGIIDEGGTILGTSRISPLKMENGTEKVFAGVERLGLEALIVLGGEGTLSLASKLFKMGLPLVGIPKTIDNDVKETKYTIGFQTAVQIATDALDRLRSTAESHHRVMVMEVMGRNTGWIATYSGLASGADAILIPEIPLTEARIDALGNMLKERNKYGKHFSLIVIAEGAKLEGTSGTSNHQLDRIVGTGRVIGGIIEKKTSLETRVSSLDYIQRGGTPIAYDRNLATTLAVKAAELIEDKKYGMMAALKGDRIVSVPLEKVEDKIKTVDMEIYRVAELFFG